MVIQSCRYASEIAPVYGAEYEEDDAKEGNGLDDGGYP